MDNLARLGYPTVLVAAALLGSGAWSDPGTLRPAAVSGPGREAVALYNTACTESQLGDADRAAASLLRAVKAGFNDFSHMRRDPDLRDLREHPVFRAIVAAREAADEELTRRSLRRWQRHLEPGRYRFEIDEKHRLCFASGLDEAAHRDMRRMLDELSAHLDRSLFGRPSSQQPGARGRVLIVVPTDRDAARLLTEPNAAGVYRHRRRELIATDPHRSLRHEFVHMLHHGHMDALGQEHPAWIQEGLASLYENYRLDPDGSIHFTANDREPLTRTLAAGGRLIPWRDLVAMPPAALRAEAARAYPQLRSMFRFIADEGHLEAWYTTYVDRFEDDATGVISLELAPGRPLDELERRWRQWLRQRPRRGAQEG
ncbi:MAG: TPR end-of-group domain-containing protein [Planctomycetota bacterium]|jgi:hypothetical protein